MAWFTADPKNLSLIYNTLCNSAIRGPHPIRQLLLSGRLSQDQIQWWARNQFHEFRNIHRFFGIRYQKCPVPELRRMLLENMVEEEGEDLFGGKYPSHRELVGAICRRDRHRPRRYFELRAFAGNSRRAGNVRVAGAAKPLGGGDRHRIGFRRRRAEAHERRARSDREILPVDSRRAAWIFSAPTNITTKATATW